MNQEWLEYRVRGITSVDEMSRLSRRPPSVFYLAAERRKGILARLIAARKGTTLVEEP